MIKPPQIVLITFCLFMINLVQSLTCYHCLHDPPNGRSFRPIDGTIYTTIKPHPQYPTRSCLKSDGTENTKIRRAGCLSCNKNIINGSSKNCILSWPNYICHICLDIIRFCGDVKGGDACYTFGEDTVSGFLNLGSIISVDFFKVTHFSVLPMWFK